VAYFATDKNKLVEALLFILAVIATVFFMFLIVIAVLPLADRFMEWIDDLYNR
jgi:hypothetical protein